MASSVKKFFREVILIRLDKTRAYYKTFLEGLIFFILRSSLRNPPAMQQTWVQFLGPEDPLEKEMATPSSICAWKIPRTQEPGGLRNSLATKPPFFILSNSPHTQPSSPLPPAVSLYPVRDPAPV